MPVRILFAVPEAGGNVPPTVVLLAELVRRGHEVRIVGHEAVRQRVEGVGATFTAARSARAWSPDGAMADPSPWRMLGWLTLATDRGFAADVVAELVRGPYDAAVVDCMLPATLAAARGGPVPVALLVHTMSGYWGEQWSARTPMGAWLRLRRLVPAAHRPALALLATDPVLDGDHHLGWPTVQTGPLLADLGPLTPALADAPVLVSLSTIGYPGQREVLARVLATLRAAGVDAVVTNPPSGVRLTSGVEVLHFTPHAELLPGVRAVIGHGGHGTALMALAHGRPVVVVPLSSHADHHIVARALVCASAGAVVRKDTIESGVSTALDRLPILAAGAQTFARRLRSAPPAAQIGADALERLASSAA